MVSRSGVLGNLPQANDGSKGTSFAGCCSMQHWKGDFAHGGVAPFKCCQIQWWSCKYPRELDRQVGGERSRGKCDQALDGVNLRRALCLFDQCRPQSAIGDLACQKNRSGKPVGSKAARLRRLREGCLAPILRRANGSRVSVFTPKSKVTAVV
jgi:hypothetical protein